MRNCLVPGVSHSLCLQVNDQLLVTAFTPHFSALADLPPVFVTAFMVGLMEWACIETLKPYLLDGENTGVVHTVNFGETKEQARKLASDGVLSAFQKFFHHFGFSEAWREPEDEAKYPSGKVMLPASPGNAGPTLSRAPNDQ